MLDAPYRPSGYGRAHISSIVRDLAALGPQNVIISDVSFDTAQTGIAVYQKGWDEPHFFFTSRYEGVFHGTGDVFASFLLSALLAGKPLIPAARLALRLTHESICLTLAENQPLRYGVQFERVLPSLIAGLREQG